MSAPATDRLTVGRWRPGKRGVLGLLLVAAFAVALMGLGIDTGVLHTGGLSSLRSMLAALGSLDLAPAFLLGTLLPATVVTVAYAVTAMSVALLVGIPGAVLASGVLTRRRWTRLGSVASTRGILGSLRAIDELIWALLLVNVFGLSPWAGILGIGLPYGATVGRVLAERLQDVPEEPLEALRSAGASPAQVLVYGRLPHALADVTSYLLYRFECAVRAAAVLSFVGLGGLGLQLTVALDDLAFGRVWTVLLALIVLIVAIDALSSALRRRILA